MPAPKKSKTRPPRFDDVSGTTEFDVTQVLGTVTVDRFGSGDSPSLAAFRIIAEFDAPGTFTFPNMYGADTTVTVAAPERDDSGDSEPV